MVDSPALQDTRLPGLATVLDPSAFGELLEQRLRAHDPSLQVRDLRIRDVQYGESKATVLARVSVRSRDFSRTGRQQLFVRVAPPELPAPEIAPRLLERYRERRERASAVDSPMPVGALAIPELGIVVYAFPLDPVLSSLVDVTDPVTMSASLNELWRRRGVKVRRVQIETLSYTPESRAALRYEVLSESRENGLPEIRHLVGKLQQRKSPAQLFAGHWAIWRASFGKVRVAPPGGYLAVAGLSLQEVVRGKRLSDLAGRGDFVKSVRQAARAIAGIHQLELPLQAVGGADREVRSVRRWIEVLRRIRPALHGRLERLESRLTSELEARVRRTAPVHSDFHLANVLVDREGVVLIDWDQVALGDPASDVGRFLGALRVSALRTTGRIGALDQVGADFVDAYLAARPESEYQIHLFEACGLVIAAASPFRLQREGWEEGADTMIAEAERRLDLSLQRPPTAAGWASPLPESKRVEWALDAVYSQALLVPLVRAVHGDDLEIYRCRPERLSPEGARLRLRWRLSGLRGEQRWKGFVEGVALSPRARAGIVRRLGALREALAGSDDCLLLPRPLAFVDALGVAALAPSWPAPTGPLELPSADGAIEQRIGRALGAAQAIAVDLGRERDGERETAAVARRIAALESAGDALTATAAALLTAIEERLVSTPAVHAALLRGLHLRELELVDGRIGVLALRDVVAGPRAISIAELLAELRAAVADDRRAESAVAALRGGWLAETGADPQELLPFEALALLRRACHEAASGGDRSRLVDRLTAAVRRILGG